MFEIGHRWDNASRHVLRAKQVVRGMQERGRDMTEALARLVASLLQRSRSIDRTAAAAAAAILAVAMAATGSFLAQHMPIVAFVVPTHLPTQVYKQ